MIFNLGQYFHARTTYVFIASLSMIFLQNFISGSVYADSVWQVSNGSNYLFDNNYFKTNSNHVSEHTLKITPSASVSIQEKRSVLNFKYTGVYGLNLNTTDENQLDHKIHTGFALKLGKTSAFDFLAEYLTSRDERGVSASPVTSGAPLANWSGKKTSANLTVPLIPKVKIKFGGTLEERNYETAYIGSSRNIISANLAAIIPATFKTAFQIKYGHQSTSYHTSTSSSSNLNHLSTGVSWRTSGKTTSYANFGFEKNSAIKTSSTYSGLFVDIKFHWKRKSYSTVDFTVSRKTTDTGNVADGSLVSNIVNISWKHRYTSKWSSTIGSNQSYDQYELGRKDAYVSPNIGISLAQSKKLSYKLSISSIKRKSNQSALDYDSTNLLAGFNFVLGSR